MHIVLFEDHLAGELRPVTLARAAFSVSMCGTNLFRLFQGEGHPITYLVRDYLRDYCAEEYPRDSLGKENVLFVNGALPPSCTLMRRILERTGENKPFLIQHSSRIACAFFPRIEFELEELDERSVSNFLRDQEYSFVGEDLPLVEYSFDIIRYNQQYFAENLEYLKKGFHEKSPGLFVGEDVTIHPTACIETQNGPVIIDEGTTILPFVYIRGPVYIGKRCTIVEGGSVKDHSHISDGCKVGGEIESSVMECYSNKQHHSFLGHSWVGSWVNVGAGTCTSDLKNTYGEVTVHYQDRKIATGMQFLGCVFGDYSKTAVNTSVFTGKAIGVASCVYGFVSTNVPSFCNYARTFGKITEHFLPSAVRTQERMFARRGLQQTRVHIKLLEDVHRITRDERIMSTETLSF